MILSAVPIWMNEVTPPRNRGMLVDIHGATSLFGHMLAAWTGNGFFYLDSLDAWRAPLGASEAHKYLHLVKYTLTGH